MVLILPIGASTLKNIIFSVAHFGPSDQNFLGFVFSFWFGCSLYKSSKFQLSSSSRCGLSFLHGDTAIFAPSNQSRHILVTPRVDVLTAEGADASLVTNLTWVVGSRSS
jgi:hypothetical protein